MLSCLKTNAETERDQDCSNLTKLFVCQIKQLKSKVQVLLTQFNGNQGLWQCHTHVMIKLKILGRKMDQTPQELHYLGHNNNRQVVCFEVRMWAHRYPHATTCLPLFRVEKPGKGIPNEAERMSKEED